MSVSKQAEQDAEVPQTFKQQATELTQRLFTVLKNSIKINEFSYDEEMTADLYYQISTGYIASPDLRAAWLQSLAQFHISVCIFHFSLMIAQSLTEQIIK